MKTYNITIQGYFLEKGKITIPASTYIFFVYRGRMDREDRMAYLSELIFIGDSSNIQGSANEDQLRKKFLETCKAGEELFYSYVELTFPEKERKLLLNAMISVIMPSLNSVNQWNGIGEEELKIVVEGPHAFIPSVMIFNS